jgi:hypothetical protein
MIDGALCFFSLSLKSKRRKTTTQHEEFVRDDVRQHRISANFFPVSCPYKSWPKSVNFGQLFETLNPKKLAEIGYFFFRAVERLET